MSGAIVTLLGAVAFDLMLGEPPEPVHPVVWMGRLQTTLRRLAPTRPAPAFIWGTVMALLGPALSGLLTWWLLSIVEGWVRLIVAIYLLKGAFAARALAAAALDARRALDEGDLVQARLALRSLVSRDTSALGPHQLAGAAIESVAENASDSLVAPLFYYAIGGIPAALAYRAINTLDAMIGYRGQTEWLGKAAARLDDLANFVPARITAFMLTLASPFGPGSPGRAIAVWRRDARCTESPNAGRPMAAMAGALGVELEKVGVYKLGAGLRDPTPGDIGRCVRIFAVTTALAVLSALIGACHVA